MCTPSHRPRGRELALAISLALLLLAYAIRELSAQFTGTVLTSPVGRSILHEFLSVPALTDDLVWFAAAQLALHIAFGTAVWLLSYTTARAGLFPAARPWHVIIAWFAACAFWVRLANANWFPWSTASAGFSRLLVEPVPGLSSLAVASTLLGGAIIYVCIVAIARSRWRVAALRCTIWGAVCFLGLAVLTNLPDSLAEREGRNPEARPNVIVIGIDSLRSDMTGPSGGSWLMPNVDAFLGEARVIPDTFTPLARTFPAWLAILTGNHPQTTGARENLIPRNALKMTPTLAERLESLGYRTVFATDEVRFSNIDTSYGFDAVVAPPIGAADFLLGTVNDLPLSNLIVNSRLGSFLFPASYANRGAAVTYRPETFIERLESDVDFESPMFLAVHLTLPHWPFRWADDKNSVFDRGGEQPYAYLSALVGVDRQFGQLMSLLAERDALSNAIVVVLSDHGEGLGLPVDNLIHSRAAKEAAGRIPVAMWGHGTSVLSPHQYGVLLAVRGYGPKSLRGVANGPLDVPATLEDVTPTLLGLLGALQPGDHFDGHSLAGLLRGDESDREALEARFRFIETAYNPPALARGDIREKALIEKGKHLFAINSSTARIEFRMDRWPELMRTKERAVVQGDWLLAALPVPGHEAHRYLLVPRRGGLPRRLVHVPDPASDPTAAALWTALNERYPGELSIQVAN